ncbi:HNH endonuclease [Microcoleus sp. F4-D5]
MVPVAKGGTDDEYNLQHVDLACHKQVHSKTQTQSQKALS